MSKKETCCPLCEGPLELRRDRTYTFKFKGASHIFEGLERLFCPACGLGISSDATAARNKLVIREFERGITGEMAPDDILELREKYSISQEQATRIFKTARRAFSKWERGENSPVAAVARMLRLALDEPEYMRMMADKAGERIDIPPRENTVSHAEFSILKEQLAKRDREDRARRQEAYEAGRKAGMMRRQFRVSLESWGTIALGAGFDPDRSEKICQEPMRWQKENPRQVCLQ